MIALVKCKVRRPCDILKNYIFFSVNTDLVGQRHSQFSYTHIQCVPFHHNITQMVQTNLFMGEINSQKSFVQGLAETFFDIFFPPRLSTTVLLPLFSTGGMIWHLSLLNVLSKRTSFLARKLLATDSELELRKKEKEFSLSGSFFIIS